MGQTELRGWTPDDREVYSYVSATPFCYIHARDTLKLDWGEREKSEAMYDSLTRKVEFLDNTRKSFYCMMCSVRGQKAIHASHELYAWAYRRTIFYDKEFCHMLVDHTHMESYHKYKGLNKYF